MLNMILEDRVYYIYAYPVFVFTWNRVQHEAPVDASQIAILSSHKINIVRYLPFSTL